MYRSILEVWPKNDDYDAVVAYYREAEIFRAAIDSGLALSCEMLVPVDRVGPIIVTSTWRSPDDYDEWASRRAEHAQVHTRIPELTILPESGLTPRGRMTHVAYALSAD